MYYTRQSNLRYTYMKDGKKIKFGVLPDQNIFTHLESFEIQDKPRKIFYVTSRAST